jgi:beta-fructofuranosidase
VSRRDPAFPSLHIRPERGWVNDPNGVSRVDGRYHVFFQHNPDTPHHGDIKWGHASSADLLTWDHHPVALVNRPGELDAYGCWSGCVVDDDGVPTAVYSAVADASGRSEVVLARSDRSMLEWKQDETSVIGMPDDPEISDVRDPFVFRYGGRRYAIQGAGHPTGRPQVLLYACDDLTRWTPLGALLTGDDPVAAELPPANIWECPNLAFVDGRWVLILSLWRRTDGVNLLTGVGYLVGDLVERGAGLAFEPTSSGTVDGGPTFYAPQLLAEPGRHLMWGWAWEHGRSPEQVVEADWAGALTFPRELSVVDGTLVSRPAAELVGLRRETLAWRPDADLAARAFEVETSGPLQLCLRDDGSEELVLDLVPHPAEPTRVLVDGSVVEAFAGPTPVTTRAYPSATSSWVLRADPACTTVWRLGEPTTACGDGSQPLPQAR